VQCMVRWFTCDTCVGFAALLPVCGCAPGLYLVLSALPEAPPQAVEIEEMHVISYKALVTHCSCMDSSNDKATAM